MFCTDFIIGVYGFLITENCRICLDFVSFAATSVWDVRKRNNGLENPIKFGNNVTTCGFGK